MSSDTDSDNTIVAETTTIYNDDGHTVIPQAVRDSAGIEPGDTVGWIEHNGGILVTKLSDDG
jgi:SpoVT / AbrB like domain.